MIRADHPCHIPHCGQVRCDSCDERLTCLGPEPALTCEGHTYCTDCDLTNQCMWCKDARAAA